MERDERQRRSHKAGKTLGHERHAVAGFHGGNQAGGTLMLFHGRGGPQRGLQRGQKSMILRIVLAGVAHELFRGERRLVHLPGLRQRVEGRHRYTAAIAAQFLKGEGGQRRFPGLYHQGQIKLAFPQARQHFLSRKILEGDPHAG
jgi:hypothetical protein